MEGDPEDWRRRFRRNLRGNRSGDQRASGAQARQGLHTFFVSRILKQLGCLSFLSLGLGLGLGLGLDLSPLKLLNLSELQMVFVFSKHDCNWLIFYFFKFYNSQQYHLYHISSSLKRFYW